MFTKEESLKLTNMCTHCGFCLETCPTYTVLRNEVHSPRGRIEAIRAGIDSPAFDTCMYCRLCETACPAGVRYGEIIIPYRKPNVKESIVNKVLENPKSLTSFLRIAKNLNIEEGKRFKEFTEGLEISEPLENDEKEYDIILFPGCMESVLARKTVEKAYRFLSKFFKVRIVNGCCGFSRFSTGDVEGARKLALNLKDKVGDKPVITLQSNCAPFMKDYQSYFGINIEAYDFAEFVIKKDLPLPKVEGVATLHYPCHAFKKGLVEPIKEMMNRMGLKLIEMEDPQFECGAAGDYWIKYPKISDMVMNVKKEKVSKANVKDVVATNTPCYLAIRKMGYNVHHIADYLP